MYLNISHAISLLSNPLMEGNINECAKAKDNKLLKYFWIIYISLIDYAGPNKLGYNIVCFIYAPAVDCIYMEKAHTAQL